MTKESDNNSKDSEIECFTKDEVEDGLDGFEVEKDISKISDEIHLAAIFRMIDDGFSDVIASRKAIEEFLLSSKGTDHAMQLVVDQTYKIVSDSLAYLLDVFQKCNVPKEMSHEIIISTKNLLFQKIAPGVIINIHKTLESRAQAKEINELQEEIRSLKDDNNTLSTENASLRLSTFISEWKPELPSMSCFKEDLQKFFKEIMTSGKSYSFVLVRMSDVGEKTGESFGLSNDSINENRIRRLTNTFTTHLFRIRDKFINNEKVLPKVEANNPEKEEELPEIEYCKELEEEDCEKQKEVMESLETMESVDIEFDEDEEEVVESLETTEAADLEFDENAEEEDVAEGDKMEDGETLDLSEICLTPLYESGVLSDDYRNENEAEFCPSNSEIYPGELEILRDNAAGMLERIRTFNGVKAYRISQDLILFAVETPLKAIIEKIDELFEILKTKDFRIDYRLSLTEVNKNIFYTVCSNTEALKSSMKVQNQAMYESLIQQLNSGISSLMRLQNTLTQRYIFEKTQRDLEMRRRASLQKAVPEKPIRVISSKDKDSDEIALELFEKLDEKAKKEESLPKPMEHLPLSPIEIKEGPKLAIGKYVSYGYNPNVYAEDTNAINPRSNTPVYVELHKLILDSSSLNDRQYGRPRYISK